MVNDNNNNRTTTPIIAVVVMMGVFSFLMLGMLSNRTVLEVAAPTATPTIQPTATLITMLPTAAPGIAYTSRVVSDGRMLYSSTCAACHGIDARGVRGLGKPLIESEFVDGLNDKQLLDFIVAGRPPWDPENTTGIDMPARGGNPSLKDDSIYAIIAYLRTQNDPSLLVADDGSPQPTAVPMVIEIRPTEPFVMPLAPQYEVTAVPLSLAPEFNYAWSCSGCHGAQGEGLEGFGPALSAWADRPDELLAFLNQLQSYDDPALGFPHPMRGEYPNLSDDDLQALVDYIQTLTQSDAE